MSPFAWHASRILVTGSAGHLGEALMRTLIASGQRTHVLGLDRVASPFTDVVASITDRAAVREAMQGVDAVIHTATLHKPHVATHTRQDFVDTNISGTLNLLEEAASAGVRAFVFSSSTSVFGDALVPAAGQPAAWISEDTAAVPKNIYGATKAAAEDLCQLASRNQGLPCVVLRVSRFFPEPDDNPAVRDAYADANIKANEFLHRRVALDDVVSAHLLAIERAAALRFARLVISATTPFEPGDAAALRVDAASVLKQRVPGFEAVYRQLGWRMFPTLDRVYSNARARQALAWQPATGFQSVIERVAAGQPMETPLAEQIGRKGYHGEAFRDGIYPVG
jgi:UDP-glucose 4-epimerase